jgi:hypothetical protein
MVTKRNHGNHKVILKLWSVLQLFVCLALAPHALVKQSISHGTRLIRAQNTRLHLNMLPLVLVKSGCPDIDGHLICFCQLVVSVNANNFFLTLQ